jgi:hypothetical protein
MVMGIALAISQIVSSNGPLGMHMHDITSRNDELLLTDSTGNWVCAILVGVGSTAIVRIP